MSVISTRSLLLGRQMSALHEHRLGVLEHWKHDHSEEDDQRHEKLDDRVKKLEIAWAKAIGWSAGGAMVGSVLMQIFFKLVGH